jgi:hypothetical protein
VRCRDHQTTKHLISDTFRSLVLLVRKIGDGWEPTALLATYAIPTVFICPV